MGTPRSVRPAMADYGVPDDLDGVLPWSWAQERLLASRNLWVVTASASGRPHAMPVWGVWLPEPGEFWFSCSPNSRKARNIAANPRVVVAVDDTVEVVSVEGVARLVEDPAQLEVMVEPYLAKYWPAEQHDAAQRAEMAAFVRSHAAFAVRPERAFGMIEREEEFSARATKWVWDPEG